ncbi:LysE family translocator [Demequina sp.]|uniref:LysE family translocator n=1 Tax=Demequina sp. TaxID=2050685 RepID=UPI003D0E7FD6
MFPSLHVLWAFGLVVALLTITPGLDTALVLRSAAVAGQRRAWGAIIGVVSGCLVWGVLAAVGVAALLAASQTAFTVLKLAGAAYMVWMGVRLIVAAIKGHTALPDAATPGNTFLAGAGQGFLTNLLNPKVGAFYVALLPQFIPPEANHVTWGITLAAVHAVLGIVWLGALSLFAGRIRPWLQRPRVTRGIDAGVGTVITGFGIKLAFTH